MDRPTINWRHFDFYLLGAVAILAIFGIAMIRSAIAGNIELLELDLVGRRTIRRFDETICSDRRRDDVPRPSRAQQEPPCMSRGPDWLAFLDAYRTLCVAPPPQVRAVFESIQEHRETA